METCYNHPAKDALSFCHNCKTYYCEECLTEGKEFYYCKKPECQKMLQKELYPAGLPRDITCPNCRSIIKLSVEEWERGKIHCPECEAVIDFTSNLPKVLYDNHYVQLLSSLNTGDIGLIKSILDDASIDYYVYGENFLHADPLLQGARFFVKEEQFEEAKELLKDFDLKIWGFSDNQY